MNTPFFHCADSKANSLPLADGMTAAPVVRRRSAKSRCERSNEPARPTDAPLDTAHLKPRLFTPARGQRRAIVAVLAVAIWAMPVVGLSVLGALCAAYFLDGSYDAALLPATLGGLAAALLVPTVCLGTLAVFFALGPTNDASFNQRAGMGTALATAGAFVVAPIVDGVIAGAMTPTE